MSDIKVADAAGAFLDGAQARADLVGKAVDIQRKRAEMEEKRIELNANKARTIFGEVKKTMLLKGKAREMQIGYVENLSRQFDIPFNPITKEYLADENNYTDLGQSLTMLSEETDNKKIAGALQGISAFMADPITEMPKIAEANAKIRQAREQARLENERKSKSVLNPQDSLKLTNETAANIKAAQSAQIETIRAVNGINTLAASEENRRNPFAQDTAQTLLAKMNDPLTGVRSQEFDRLSGLDDSTIEQAQKWVAKAARGDGKLDDDQWRQIITVANAMGQVSQMSLDRVKSQRSPELAQAGVNPDSVFSQLGSWEQFDFSKQGWETPAAFTQRKLVKQEKEGKQQENQAALNALKGFTPEQQKALVAQRREKLKSQVAKAGKSNGQKQTTK